MPKSVLYTDPKIKGIAKILRKNSSLGEILLWKELRSKQMLGYDFKRKKSIDKYIVDFYCAALNLAIEIDGVSHVTDDNYRYDRERDAKLGKIDVHFLRFKDSAIQNDMKSVLVEIEMWIKEQKMVSPKK
ncbi:MAG: endonuclease domain-containing protein [Bacteriovoracaceae bacterium]|nr:endonuclease domain-containing protein [Bacteroidota bacterium]